MMRRFLIVLAAGIAGCGGGGASDTTATAGPVTVVDQYEAALQDQDREAVCGLLAPGSRAACEKMPLKPAPDLYPASVQVHGNTARVHLESGGYLDLVRVDSHWYLQLVR